MKKPKTHSSFISPAPKTFKRKKVINKAIGTINPITIFDSDKVLKLNIIKITLRQKNTVSTQLYIVLLFISV
jgi:hypothetical protein